MEQMDMIIKKANIIFLFFIVVCFLIATVFFVSCSPATGETETTSEQEIITPGESKSNTKGSTGNESNTSDVTQDFESFLETKGFLDVMSSFYYPDSDIIKVEQEEADGNLFYILLETTDNLEKVKEYYKEKQIQSVWSRAVIYEESATDIEEEFLEEENENIPTCKFTYNSNDKNKVVNVLIRGLEENRTRIMIISWNLQ
jgi:hypothetical protein